jgi:chaperonin GroES
MTRILEPLYDRVIVKRLENEEKTEGGIIIPDSAQEKTQLGVIQAVGSGKLLPDGKLRPLTVKPNDKVAFGKYAGIEIKFEGQEWLILKEDELLGIIK